ncbi:MAG: hypothetical protein WCI39_11810 [Gallionellaceae bacterium]
MQNFFSKLSFEKWSFAISMHVLFFLIDMGQHYFYEIAVIKQKSMNSFGGDITPNLGLFEVLKSADFSFMPGWHLLTIFVPFLIMAAYFFDYKNEPHAGWRRVFLSVQVIVPTFVAITGAAIDITFNDYFSNSTAFVMDAIRFFGRAGAVVVLIILFSKWVRAGFAAKTESDEKLH